MLRVLNIKNPNYANKVIGVFYIQRPPAIFYAVPGNPIFRLFFGSAFSSFSAWSVEFVASVVSSERRGHAVLSVFCPSSPNSCFLRGDL